MKRQIEGMGGKGGGEGTGRGRVTEKGSVKKKRLAAAASSPDERGTHSTMVMAGTFSASSK